MRSTRSVLRVARLRRPLLVAAVLGGALAVLAPASAAQAEPSLDSIEKQIDTKSASLEKVVEQYNKVNEELKATQRQAAAVSEKIKPLQAELTTAGSEPATVEVLVNQDDPLKAQIVDDRISSLLTLFVTTTSVPPSQ